MSFRHAAYGVGGQAVLFGVDVIFNLLFDAPMESTQTILVVGFLIGLAMSLEAGR